MLLRSLQILLSGSVGFLIGLWAVGSVDMETNVVINGETYRMGQFLQNSHLQTNDYKFHTVLTLPGAMWSIFFPTFVAILFGSVGALLFQISLPKNSDPHDDLPNGSDNFYKTRSNYGKSAAGLAWVCATVAQIIIGFDSEVLYSIMVLASIVFSWPLSILMPWQLFKPVALGVLLYYPLYIFGFFNPEFVPICLGTSYFMGMSERIAKRPPIQELER